MNTISGLGLAKTAVFIILAIAFIGSLVWLWQRQPQPTTTGSQTPQSATDQAQVEKSQESFISTPGNFTVQTTALVNIEGQSQPNNLIAIYSNNFQNVVQADQNGRFQKEISLADGLNLINVVAFSQDTGQQETQSRVLYLGKSNDLGQTVYAGSVKSIFDTLLTVTTLAGDKNIRTSKSTDFDIPKDEDEKEATSAARNIRVGDYAIALGDSQDEDTQVAKKVEIIRRDKPQNNIKVSFAKIISTVRQNLVSIKASDNQIIELTLPKKPKIQKGDQESDVKAIAKDQSAIIFYHQDQDKNLVDLIYLLP